MRDALLPCLLLLSAFASALGGGEAQRQPNFLVILLDDADLTMGSIEQAMPATMRLLGQGGVTFANHIVTTPICCPSRVNLLRGQLSHNTNFTDVLGPHGGYAKFRALGLDREWLPVWLRRQGYATLYTGKFIVDYTVRNRDPPPAGWTVFDALVHPFTFEYYCPAFSLNGGPPRAYPAQYVTDVLSAKARALLASAAADPAGRPFYLQVSTPAPHHSMHYDYGPDGVLRARHWYPPVPAARHWEEHSGAGLPRPASFNEKDTDGKPAWLRELARLTPANETFLEEVFRLRLRSLASVDEMVADLVSDLWSLNLADSTYVLLTSDNGYHVGVHRMGSGKTTAYEEDLRVPLLLAGPGLRAGSTVSTTTAHIDLAPTVLALAGAPLPATLDGTPLPLAAASDGGLPGAYALDGGSARTCEPPRNQLVAEFWGTWDDESIHSHPPYRNNTWKAVRVLRNHGAGAYKYILHCSGEYELYDLAADPHERINLLAPYTWGSNRLGASFDGANGGSGSRRALAALAHAGGSAVAALGVWAGSAWARVAAAVGGGGNDGCGQPSRAAVARSYGAWLPRLRTRLDALLAVLAVCRGASCVRPFEVIHGPAGGVHDLWAAMDERYDTLYNSIPPFAYGTCLPYQDTGNERSPFRAAVEAAAAAEAAAAQAAAGAEGGAVSSGGAASGIGGVPGGSGVAGFRLVEAEVERWAEPLPRRYELVTDVYGSTAAQDAMLLA